MSESIDCLSDGYSTGITNTIARQKAKLVRVLLIFIASIIHVARASLILLRHKSKWVRVLLTLIGSAIDITPASLIPQSYKVKLTTFIMAEGARNW